MKNLIFVWIVVVILAGVRGTPIADYVFTQQGCKDALWMFGDGLNFTRNPLYTSCPSYNGFEYISTGPKITTLHSASMAFVSTPIADQWSEVTSFNNDSALPRNMSYALWFTANQTWLPDGDDGSLLVDVSVAGASTAGFSDLLIKAHSDIIYAAFEGRMYSSTFGVHLAEEFWARTPTFNAVPVTGVLFVSYATNASHVIGLVQVYKWNGLGVVPTTLVTGTTIKLGSNVATFLQLVLTTNARLYIGGSQYAAGNSMQSWLNTSFHRFTLWNQSFTESQIQAFAQLGPPPNAPSAKNTSFEAPQAQSISVLLNTTESIFDVDGRVITHIRVRSLVTEGILLYDGEEITDIPFVMTDASLLSFVPASSTYWSTPNCDATSFLFDASNDGVLYSVSSSYAIICVVKILVVESVTYGVPQGWYVTFHLNITSSDGGEVTNGTIVTWEFASPDFISFYFEDCVTPVVAGTEYVSTLGYCAATEVPIGTDFFFVSAYGTLANTSEPGNITVQSLIPVQAYDGTATTYEYPSSVNFSLVTFDGLGRTPLWGVILTLPSHGTLSYPLNGSLVAIGDIVTGEINYQGDPFYFNRYPSGQLNPYNEPSADPDTFTFRTRYQNESSTSVGTMSMEVILTFSPEFSVSGLTGTIPVALGEVYTFGDRIQITDPDGEAYLIAVYVISQYGDLIFTVDDDDLVAGSDLILGTCGSQMNSGCTEVAFAARPRRANLLLGNMTFELDSSAGLSAKVTIKFYKPSPAGITQGNFASTLADAVPLVYANIPVDILVTPTSSPVTGSGDTLLANLLIASLVISGIGALCIFGAVVYFLWAFWSRVWAAAVGVYHVIRYGVSATVSIVKGGVSLAKRARRAASSVSTSSSVVSSADSEEVKPVDVIPATVATPVQPTTTAGRFKNAYQRKQKRSLVHFKDDEEEYMYDA